MTIIAATGHRPNKLGGYGEEVTCRLLGLATSFLMVRRPDQVISGMALGWDQVWAVAAIRLGIPLIAAVPCAGQDSRWPPASREKYRKILRRAAHVEILADVYTSRVMQARNEWMVDHADEICALWNGTIGGTCNCVLYAREKQKPVTNLWSTWEASCAS